MMVHLAWFGLGVLTALTVVAIVMLEAEHRLHRNLPPIDTMDVDKDREVLKALAEWDTRWQAMQPPLAKGIKGFDRTGRRLH